MKNEIPTQLGANMRGHGLSAGGDLMTYEQLRAHQVKIGQWPLSKEAVYNMAIAECAKALGMSEKALIAMMRKGQTCT